jgi:hypothetical protein
MKSGVNVCACTSVSTYKLYRDRSGATKKKTLLIYIGIAEQLFFKSTYESFYSMRLQAKKNVVENVLVSYLAKSIKIIKTYSTVDAI